MRRPGTAALYPRPPFFPRPRAHATVHRKSAWDILSDPSLQPEWPSAYTRYNNSVAKLFDQLHCGEGDWPARADRLGTTIAPADRQTADPAEFDALFPASKVSVRRENQRHVSSGLGVPLAGWKKTTPINVPRPAFQPPTGMPMNATLRFDRAGEPVWHFVKRWIGEDFPVGNARHDLAADWTAPNVFYWNMSNLDDPTVQNFLLPGRYMEETGLYFLQPYDPEKIPLVMVHGLKSSPDAFRHLINNLSPSPGSGKNTRSGSSTTPPATPGSTPASASAKT